MRNAFAVAAAVAAAALLAGPAEAKDGVRAKLDRPGSLGPAAAGETRTVKWRLVDENGEPFGASGSPCACRAAGERPSSSWPRARATATRRA